MKTNKLKKKRVTIYINPKYYEKLKIVAKKKDRSVSWKINDIFREIIEG